MQMRFLLHRISLLFPAIAGRSDPIRLLVNDIPIIYLKMDSTLFLASEKKKFATGESAKNGRHGLRFVLRS